jgi:Domain of unknown function (DUF397)
MTPIAKPYIKETEPMEASTDLHQGAPTFLTSSDIPGSAWRKSQQSISNGACVEVAEPLAGVIAVRDSKNPLGPVLTYDSASWNAFLDSVKKGDFELR